MMAQNVQDAGLRPGPPDVKMEELDLEPDIIKLEEIGSEDDESTTFEEDMKFNSTDTSFIKKERDEGDKLMKDSIQYEESGSEDESSDEKGDMVLKIEQGTSSYKKKSQRKKKTIVSMETDDDHVHLIALKTKPEPGQAAATDEASHETDGVDDRNEKTTDEGLLNDDSDLDMDIDEDVDLALMRNAASEPACDSDMTALMHYVLKTEDDLNDQYLRNLVLSDNYYRFNWKGDRTVFSSQRETFTGDSGPTFDLTDMTPVDIFRKILDNDFIDLMCVETNRYAEQKLASLKATNKLLPTSRLQRWTPTNRDEMLSFLAVLILQGLYPMHDDEKYFCFNGFGTMPYFCRIMSYNRFLLLKTMYHFVNNQALTDNTKLSKIQPVINHFNEKFSTLYMPSQEIAIDEGLLKSHRRLSFAQKITTKAAEIGVKTYELCECRTGYLWKFIAYVGKNTETALANDIPVTCDRLDDDTIDPPEKVTLELPDRPQNETVDSSAKIIIELVKPLLYKGHTIVMDNFYNSPLLLRCLKRQKTDCYGTIRLSREFFPKSLKKITKTDIRRGEVVTSYCSDLSIMVWRDANLVSMISTYHNQLVAARNEHKKLTYKPKIVLDYNKSMGNVDRKDQFLKSHAMERLSNKIWYKKVFCRLLNTAVFNSFVIFATKNTKMSHRDFRVVLAEDLLKLHRRIDLTTEPRFFANKSGKMTIRTKNNGPPTVGHNHFPARSDLKSARCRHCSRYKRQSRTTWKCIQCNVSLCLERCFRDYHKT